MALLTILIGVLGRIVSQVYQYTSITHKQINRELERELLFDVLKRDGVSASSNKHHWDEANGVFKKYSIDKNGNVFSCDIGFIVDKKNVVRYEGEYDFIKQRWIDKRPSMLAQGIVGLQFLLDVDTRGNVKGFWINRKLDEREGRYQFYVSLRNREI